MFYSKATGGFYSTAIHGENMPADAVHVSAERYAELMALQSSGKRITADESGAPVAVDPPAPTQAEKCKLAENAIQTMLDGAAQAAGYENIVTASSYASLPAGAPFQAEGADFNLWRANCWAKAYEILGAVQAGARPEPTMDELLAEMPAAPNAQAA